MGHRNWPFRKSGELQPLHFGSGEPHERVWSEIWGFG